MRDRYCKVNVPHAFATHPGGGHLHPATITYLPLVLGPLITTTRALHVARWAEYTLAEKTAALRLKGAVINRLGVLHLSTGPAVNIVRTGNSDTNLIEILRFFVIKIEMRHMVEK